VPQHQPPELHQVDAMKQKDSALSSSNSELDVVLRELVYALTQITPGEEE